MRRRSASTFDRWPSRSFAVAGAGWCRVRAFFYVLGRGAYVLGCGALLLMPELWMPEVAVADSPAPIPPFEVGAVLGPESEPKIDHVLVLKSERRLILLSEEQPVYEYSIALGGAPEGPKRKQGDQRTPEGQYSIDWRKLDSDYHLALHISYPNAEDRRQARQLGVPPGGAIMIHGLPNGLGIIGAAHRVADWTDGCIAVANDEMEEIWRRIDDGVSIEIRP